jgi:hypothetical protein
MNSRYQRLDRDTTFGAAAHGIRTVIREYIHLFLDRLSKSKK